MSLETGDRVGPYEISGLLGKGGMGEVYRARDTRLDRTVAVKTLHPELSAQSEFRERFVREARAISALNHAHICTLYDVGQQDTLSYLVMEYIAGDPLSARLKKGPMPLPEALDCAAQVADALDHAHRHGVVHRDLKPANILMTKAGAKLLDFGIAKLLHPQPAGELVDAPTVTSHGMVVGTLHYMAPEQLQAQEVDARADLFALGCVIYEMLFGVRAFDGGSQATIMAKIVGGEPERIADLASIGPPEVERIVRRCLAKDPDERWQTARDLRAELKWVSERLTQPRPAMTGSFSAAGQAEAPGVPAKGRNWLPWIVAAASLVLAAVAVPWAVTRTNAVPANDGPVAQFAVTAPGGSTFVMDDEIGGSAISPNGRLLAMVITTAGKPMLTLRPIESLDMKTIEGTEGAAYPFWSPGSDWIGFFAGEKLKKVPVAGGLPQTVCDAPEPHGGAWSRDGWIVFAPETLGPLYRVRDTGGSPEPLTKPNVAEREISHSWPYLTGNGKLFYLARTAKRQANFIYAVSLDNPQSPVRLVPSNLRAAYVAVPGKAAGNLLFVRDGSLMVQAFDPASNSMSGEPRPIAFNVKSMFETGYAGFSASDNGVLVHRSGSSAGRHLRSVSRSGQTLAEVGDLDNYISVRLSPDGTNMVVTRLDSDSGLVDLWLVDPVRKMRTRLTFDDGVDISPVWSPRADQILFASSPQATLNLYRKTLDAGSDPVLFSKSANHLRPTDWSRDGQWIVYQEHNPKTRIDIWMMPAAGGGSPKPLARSPFNEYQGQLSPDGKWLAYTSDDSGRAEVYLRAVNETGTPYRVSVAGGFMPRWRGDGRELFFVSLDGKLNATSIAFNTAGQVASGAPAVLFDLPAPGPGVSDYRYDVDPKGDRFVVIIPDAAEAREFLSVTVNWHRNLR